MQGWLFASMSLLRQGDSFKFFKTTPCCQQWLPAATIRREVNLHNIKQYREPRLSIWKWSLEFLHICNSYNCIGNSPPINHAGSRNSLIQYGEYQLSTSNNSGESIKNCGYLLKFKKLSETHLRVWEEPTPKNQGQKSCRTVLLKEGRTKAKPKTMKWSQSQRQLKQ
jgi:hypothetical protein